MTDKKERARLIKSTGEITQGERNKLYREQELDAQHLAKYGTRRNPDPIPTFDDIADSILNGPNTPKPSKSVYDD